MSKESDKPKRGRGRPSTLPAGARRTINCVLVNGEMDLFRDALVAAGLSQRDFSRACILHAIREIQAGRMPHWLKPKKK